LSDTEYGRYVRAEWALFARDPARRAAAREAVADLTVGRVLDIGCGAGQELRPFASDDGVLAIGVDPSPEVGVAGRELFAVDEPQAYVRFVRAAAEHLPFATASFDVVICRLALPYTDNARALREMARMLRPAGALFLKFHHARYYVRKLWDGIADGEIKSAIHACRVLVAGAIYHAGGIQPRGRLSGGETFQTMWMLERVLRENGLRIERLLADSAAATPSVLVRRASG